jgi:hypothetical protein
MAAGSDGGGLKSAYELALERLESQGIERPDATALSSETRELMSQARIKAQAKLAEIEIMHGKSLEGIFDPLELEQAGQQYRAERQRIEARRDGEIETLRSAKNDS